jgi:hypothetical protein
MRPCHHCGSGKHWDLECKYSQRRERLARVNFAEVTKDEVQAQAEYDDAYYELESDRETNELEQDF